MLELDNATLRRLERMIFYVRGVMVWEQLWPRLWPFMILASLFLSAILFDLFSLLSPQLHMLVLGLCGLGLFGLLVHAFAGVRIPTKRNALHKIERDNDLKHQPLFALLDHPVGESRDKFQQTVWLNHQDRMVQAMGKVTLRGPKFSLEDRDPYCLSIILVIILLLGAVEARFDFTDRLARSFAPASHVGMTQNWKIEAWINPPAHTGLGPTFLSANQDSPPLSSAVEIAQHSELLLRLEGRPTRDQLSVSVGPFVEKLENLGRGNFSLETRLEQGQTLKVMRNEEAIYSWPIRLKMDEPPSIKLSGKPRSGFRGHMTLGFKAEDDYGLQQVQLIIRALEKDSLPDLVLVLDENERDVTGRFRANLADHPWAGQDVVMTPVAIDSAGQQSHGTAIQSILPERKFTHPVALRLINIRKSMVNGSPEDHVFGRIWLDRILRHPEDFQDDVAIYLALRVASDRMHAVMADVDVQAVRAILWETAVRLEEGASGSARNQLEFMSRQMQDLMQNAQDSAAMEALFEQMQQSLDQFLQKMAQSMPKMDGFENLMPPENADMIGRDELMDLLNKARELMRAGNTQAAKEVMEQFQSILSRLAMQPPVDPNQMKAASEVVKKLQQLEKDQQKLLDETFQRTRNQDRPSLSSTRKALEQAEQQQKLLEHLREQMKRLQAMQTKTPKALIEAEKAMQRAVQSLERGLDETAVQAQTHAVDQLREGLKDSAQALAQKMGMQPMPQQLPGYDPLGRRGSKGTLQGETGQSVPTDAEMKQSREILKELYRRAGQKGRAEQELKYIERLLERF
ncbi:DUF4175 family protein [Terasakiella sp. A23]|uniref:DUF4175 domain-containing protein n=1 Tax=Terasakiella sp. FCG-A23 TaxID=3080561 RepID=UPI002955C13A|nr:DUF4175 family protein [Terasakiella sp. A23]MDV7338178.1 DUF4175 family protein [Terasakiella sp. A23]